MIISCFNAPTISNIRHNPIFQDLKYKLDQSFLQFEFCDGLSASSETDQL